MAHITVPATQIVGRHVENWSAENLGTITDIMIDKRTGEVSYIVLSYPGEYGLRYPSKRFAVPFEAFILTDANTDIDYILNVDQAFLEKSPGFDIQNWPDFADPKFNANIKDYYRDITLNVLV